MGKALLDASPLFKATIQECQQALSRLPDCPDWLIAEELSMEGECSNVYNSAYSQPLCTAIQIGLVRLWASWGLVPTAVVGHSSGEIAAAFAAGFLSLRDAMTVAFYRGLCLKDSRANGVVKSTARGSMCAVTMSEEEATRLIADHKDRVQLAAVNSGNSCTLSGDESIIKQIITDCANKGIFCRGLKVDMGKHNLVMVPATPMLTQF